MIRGHAHVCFTVSDLDAAEAFYCDKLGLRRGFDFRDAQGARKGVYIRVGGRCFIELFTGKVDGGATGGSFRHFCLEVDDIRATVETLRSRGVAVTDVKLGADHSHQAWLADPDGNRIELHEYTPESWQKPLLDD